MVKDSDGVWSLRIELDLKDQFYNYIVINHGQSYEIVDPYAKAATANSKRAMIIDMEETNPEGWLEHPVPMPVAPCSSLLYEAHIRDFSVDKNSDMKYKGLYLSLTEKDTFL